MQTLIVIWQRFGPYHLARLRGAIRAFGDGWRVIGIEVAGQDHYAWNTAVDAVVQRHTLFACRSYESLTRGEIRRAVLYALDQLQPSAVAINGWSVPEAVAALQWCRRNDRPRILMSETHEASRNAVKSWIKARRIRQCDSALVGGAWHVRYLVQAGFLESLTTIGYDSIDNDYFAEQAAAAQTEGETLRRALKLPGNYFLANSRFIPRKNIDGLLRSYAQFRELAKTRSNPDTAAWDLVVCGDGESGPEWKQLADELGIAPFVYWPGFVQYERLPAYYGFASGFVHPARSEPWGLVVNEAASCGLPLILGNQVGAACELLHPVENGWLVNPDNTDDFARALHRLWSMSVDERTLLGRRSKELAARFHPDEFGKALRHCVEMAQRNRMLLRAVS